MATNYETNKRIDSIEQTTFRFSHMEFAYFYVEMPVKSVFDPRDTTTVAVDRANR